MKRKRGDIKINRVERGACVDLRYCDPGDPDLIGQPTWPSQTGSQRSGWTELKKVDVDGEFLSTGRRRSKVTG